MLRYDCLKGLDIQATYIYFKRYRSFSDMEGFAGDTENFEKRQYQTIISCCVEQCTLPPPEAIPSIAICSIV